MGSLNERPQPQQEPQGSEVGRQGVLEAWLRLPEVGGGGGHGKNGLLHQKVLLLAPCWRSREVGGLLRVTHH